MKTLAIAAVLLLGGAALSGCTPQADASPQTAVAETSQPAENFDKAALALSYRVQGGGSYVQGSRDLCDLISGDAILIEDEKEVANYDGSKPFSSMSLGGGRIQYATTWPDDIVGTGLTGGTGTYVLNADASGQPVTITGHATITYHDATTKTDTKKSDDVTFTLTPIARPAYCP